MAFEVWFNQNPTIQAAFQGSAYEPGNSLVFESPEFGFLHFTHLMEGLLLVIGLTTTEVPGTELIGEGALQIRELLAEQFQLIEQSRTKGTSSPSSASGGSQNSPAPLGLWAPGPIS